MSGIYRPPITDRDRAREADRRKARAMSDGERKCTRCGGRIGWVEPFTTLNDDRPHHVNCGLQTALDRLALAEAVVKAAARLIPAIRVRCGRELDRRDALKPLFAEFDRALDAASPPSTGDEKGSDK